MKKVVLGSTMKMVDNITISEIGIPSMVLMERAALCVTEIISKNENVNKSVLVVAGTGNNGADGLSVCRMLYQLGYDTCIYILGDMDNATEEFKQQLNIVKNLGIKLINRYEQRDVIVDSLLGVGINRNVIGSRAELIKKINSGRNVVYSIDIPSGISADTGKVLGEAIKADYTITFSSYKVGNLLYPGTKYCGKLILKDIGIPGISYENVDKFFAPEIEDMNLIPKRPDYSNKGTFGKTLIIAGSKDVTGAAYFCGKAAFRVGAGLVRIFTPNENREVIQKLLPEAMVNTYDTDNFDLKALEACINWCDVIAIGPGLGIGSLQKNIIKTVLISQKKAVIDADGINNISDDARLKKLLHKRVIVTPHLLEASRLLNQSIEEISEDLIKATKEINYRFNVNCILKDARTVIATKDNVYFNTTGNNGMATAGMGDVLAGITVGLLSIGLDIEKASFVAPYIHGLSGDMAAKRVSKTSLMAGDVIDELGNIFK